MRYMPPRSAADMATDSKREVSMSIFALGIILLAALLIFGVGKFLHKANNMCIIRLLTDCSIHQCTLAAVSSTSNAGIMCYLARKLNSLSTTTVRHESAAANILNY